MKEAMDFGHGHLITIVEAPESDYHIAEPFLGLVCAHKAPDGTDCVSSILFDCDAARAGWPGREMWTVTQRHPLTIKESLLCRCGDHGYIRNGKWVPW